MYYYIVAIGTPNLTKKAKRKIIRFTNSFVFGIIFGNLSDPKLEIDFVHSIIYIQILHQNRRFVFYKYVPYDLKSLLKSELHEHSK